MVRNEIAEPEAVKPTEEAAQPVTVKTTLSGPTFMLGPGVPSCSLKLPSEILGASGLKGNDQVELTAGSGTILITKTGDALPGLPNLPSKNRLMEELRELTEDYEKREREARAGYNLVDPDEPESILSGDIDGEDLVDGELDG